MSNTGGQVAIRGFLYQILCSLGQVARLALTDGGEGDAKLTLEPSSGDLAIAERSIFIVEQFKSRRTGRPWTTGEVIERVLPDLLDAARAAPAAIPLKFRFVTDGTCQTDDLRRLLALVRSSDVLGVLEMSHHKIPFEGRMVTPLEYVTMLAERLHCGFAHDKALLRLLSAFEIIDKFNAEDVTSRIDIVLGKLVDAREDIEGKRNELVGRLFEAAQEGGDDRDQTVSEAGRLGYRAARHGRALAVCSGDRPCACLPHDWL